MSVLKIAVAAAVMAGWASYYDDGPGLYGAVNSYRFGDPTYPVEVCAGERCVTVTVRDFCACGPRHGVPTVIDLSPQAFRQLRPLRDGIVRVTVRRTDGPRLPPTDTP